MRIFNSKRMSKNKRGEDMLVDFWAILVFALIILLFFILFKTSKMDSKTNQITAQLQNEDIDYMLNSFLRAPAIGIDESKTVSEIIVEDYFNEDFTRTEILFKQFYKNTIEYKGKVNDITLEIVSNKKNGGPFEIIQEGGSSSIGKLLDVMLKEYTSHKTSATIPMYDGMLFVHLNIFVWKNEAK